jgi:hypothetical protein
LYSQLAADAFDRSEPLQDPQGQLRPQRVRVERSLDIYASWFENLPARLSRRLRRLSSSPVDIGIQAVAASERPGDGGDPATHDDAGAAGGPGARGDTEAGDGTNGSAAQMRSAWEPLQLPPRGERVAALRSVLAAWRSEIRRFTRAHTPPEPTDRASELAYLISAADYVSAVAAGRRGDDAARARSLARLSEADEQLFARIEYILERVTEQDT